MATVDKVRIKRGLAANIGTLDLGETYLADDDNNERFYIGGKNGNVAIPNSVDATNIQGQITNVTSTANTANTTANNALGQVNSISTTVTTANQNASTALSTANTASQTATTANTTATNALNKANDVDSKLDNATTTANTALSTANTAKTTADNTSSRVDNLVANGTTGSLQEAVDARTDANSVVHDNLKARCDSDYNTLNNNKSNKTDLVESTGYGIVNNGLKVVAQSTPNMTVSVDEDIIYMANGNRFMPEANTALAIDASDSTKPRKDIIYVNSNGVISYLAGSLGAAAIPGSEAYTISTNAVPVVAGSIEYTIATNAKPNIAGSNTYTISTNIVSGDVVIFNDIGFTATTSTQDGTHFAVGVSIANTATNLATALNANATISAIYTAVALDDVITITEKVAGGGHTPSTMSVTGTGVINTGTAIMSKSADTVVIEGITFLAVDSNATGNEFIVGTTINDTANNLKTALNAHTTINALYTASVSTNIITLTEKVAGNGNTPSNATCTGTIVINNSTAITSKSADTITINNITFTAVLSGAVGNEFNVGSSTTLTATNLASALNSNSTISALYTATSSNNIVALTEKIAGNGNTPSIANFVGTVVINNGTAITSTPESSTAPNVPNGGQELAEIYIEAGSSTIINNNIIDKRIIKKTNNMLSTQIENILSNSVESINNKIGIVTLNAIDVGATSSTDFNAHVTNYMKHIPYAVATNSGNNYSVTITNLTELIDGLEIRVKFNSASTGAVTINVNNLGAKNIVDYFGNVITNIRQNLIANLVYEAISDNFIFIAQGSNESGSGDMSKSTYDTNNNGIVDNSEELGGQLPTYYAKESDLNNHITDYTKHFIVCTSTTRPSNPQTGQHIYETDTEKDWKWTGIIWKEIDGTTSSDTTPPGAATNFTAVAGNAQVTLSWNNPTDSDFAGVKILRQTGAYPTNITDGTVIYTGANVSYTDTTVTNGTTYYYRIFPYDTSGNYNTNTIGQLTVATPKASVIYGVQIDTTNSNPETALIYVDDAVGFTAANGNNGSFNYGSWQDKFPFNEIKPCLYKNGAVNYYLDPNDYTKKADGTTASDITSGNDGDVMIEFPKIYWKFETVGIYLYITYSNVQIDSGYKCLAHMRGATEKDKCYIGAYLGYYDGKLRSLSGKTPTVNQTIGTFRTYAQANGTGYDQMAYYQLLMLQVLYVVMFKNLDSQTALGKGYTDSTNTASIATGGTNTKGMFYGETTGKLQNKFCGIEDFYGNLSYQIDGLFCNLGGYILIANQNFNDTGSGYTDYGQNANVSGCIATIQGSTETGFIVKTGSGSETTYYCDYGQLYTDSKPFVGGDYSNGLDSGAFFMCINMSSSYTHPKVGARLIAL